MHRYRLIAGLALGLCISVAALGAEKKIKESKLPPAVQKTAAEHSSGATVSGYTSDKIDGNMVYQMDLVADGKTRAIVMDADGNVTSIEQEVAFSDLPEDIQKAFSTASSKGKLGEVSTVTTDGVVVAYEAVFIVKGERSHVRVKPKTQAAMPAPAVESTK
jgi:hypothetical protein